MILKALGIVENIGLSNVNAEQLKRAIKIGGTPAQGGVVSVQNEWSPRYRHGADVLALCEEYGIAFLPWSPLGGVGNASILESDSYSGFNTLAKSKGVSIFALTIAWHLANSPVVIPIPGATRKESILDSLKGADIVLSSEELTHLNGSLPQDLGPIHHELLDQPPFRD